MEKRKRLYAGKQNPQGYSTQKPLAGWRLKLHEIIFEADTPEGKLFDVLLLVFILLSVLVVMLESVESINHQYGYLAVALEWFFTVLFTGEFVLRLLCVKRPLRYVFSFFGLVDLLSILPTYLGFFFPGVHNLLVIRTIRLLRVFRIFKLVRFLREARVLGTALRASWPKISVFLLAVMSITIILGSLMYMIEGRENGFTSIPVSIYWAIVTLTTVGYGDITPATTLGKMLASLIMIMGYGILAVPTGIVSVELAQAQKEEISTQACTNCGREGHDFNAQYCKFCGSPL